MSTTNILDLNNRIDGLADGVTSVQGAVDEIRSNLTIQRATVTDEHFTSIKLSKIGNVKQLTIATTGSDTAMNTASDYVKYFTLPDGFRPLDQYNERFVSKKPSSTTDTDWIIRIDTTGDVFFVNYNGEEHPGFFNSFTFI